MRTNPKWKCDTIQGSPRKGRAGQGPERGYVCAHTGFELSVSSLAKIAVITGKYLHLGFKTTVSTGPSPLSLLRRQARGAMADALTGHF